MNESVVAGTRQKETVSGTRPVFYTLGSVYALQTVFTGFLQFSNSHVTPT
jgi:hypothetical protein